MPSTSIAHLPEILQEDWRNIPEAVLSNLIENMLQSVAAVIAARDGDHEVLKSKDISQVFQVGY